jgi:hypothetical protein
MIILNYQDGIHPLSGKEFKVVNDIVITPFWTEEFCKQLIHVAEICSSKFNDSIIPGYVQLGWHDLRLDNISPIFFQDYTQHYKKDIYPLLVDTFTKESADIFGWFPPYIIRYNELGQCTGAHNDVSKFTLNIKLNSDYEGCDLTFSRQNFNAKEVPVGYAMIWPSTITHPHYSTPLISGTKYSFVSWSWPAEWTGSGIKNLHN